MLHAGMDLSRRRLDICLLDERGELVGETAVPPDLDGLRGIVREPDRHEILVRSSSLALGVDALYEGDRVAFDVDMGTDAQVRNVMRT